METFTPALDKAFLKCISFQTKGTPGNNPVLTPVRWTGCSSAPLHPEHLQDDALLRAPASRQSWPCCKVNAAEHFKTIFTKSCNTKHFKWLPFPRQNFRFSYFYSLLRWSGWQLASVKAGLKSSSFCGQSWVFFFAVIMPVCHFGSGFQYATERYFTINQEELCPLSQAWDCNCCGSPCNCKHIVKKPGEHILIQNLLNSRCLRGLLMIKKIRSPTKRKPSFSVVTGSRIWPSRVTTI